MEYEIKPPAKFSFGLKELWDYRELLYFFAWRDIKVKYKQTVLGVLWVVFQPLLLMLVFTFLLKNKFSEDLPGGISYSVFVLAGVSCWSAFSASVNSAGNGMITNAAIIKKIYFPRLIIPISAIVVAFIDLMIALVLYFLLFIYFKPSVQGANLLLIPVCLLLIFMASFGIGSLTSALNVKYRDVRYILPFFVQALMFVSPVFYPLHKYSYNLQFVFALNPMYAPIELFRSHLSGYTINEGLIVVSILSNLFIFILGIVVFRKTERFFADLT